MPFVYQNRPKSYILFNNEGQKIIDLAGKRRREEQNEKQDLALNILTTIAELALTIGVAILTGGTSIPATVAAKTTSFIANTTARSIISSAVKGATIGAISSTAGGSVRFITGTTTGKAEEAAIDYFSFIGISTATGALSGAFKSIRSSSFAFKSIQTRPGLTNPARIKLSELLDVKISEKLGLSQKNINSNVLNKNSFSLSAKTNPEKLSLRAINKMISSKNKLVRETGELIKGRGNIGTEIKKNILNESEIISLNDKSLIFENLDGLITQTALSPNIRTPLTFISNKLKSSFTNFLKGKINNTQLFKSYNEQVKKYLILRKKIKMKVINKIKNAKLTIYLKNTFNIDKIKSKFDTHFKKQHDELMRKYQQLKSGDEIETEKLKQDMDNFILETQEAVPFGEGDAGSSWLLGYKWIITKTDPNKGWLRVFFKTQILKNSKRKVKGKTYNRNPIKDAITFKEVPTTLLTEFEATTSKGSFYYDVFGMKRIKGGTKTQGWQPRSTASINFLIDRSNQKQHDLYKTYGVEVLNQSKQLTSQFLGYNEKSKVIFKYFNQGKKLKNVLLNPVNTALSTGKGQLSKRLKINKR